MIYHTLYYVTHQTEQREAIEEFVILLLDKGFHIDFVQSMQFILMPQSKITGFYGIMAQYWE